MENTEISDEENERISSMSSWNTPLACFEKLNEIYEERLTMAKGETGSDVTELYCSWVQDLITQNRTYLTIIQELETESRKRLLILSKKLEEDTMKFTGDTKYKDLKNDIKELLKFIRNSEKSNKWNVDDLDLKTICTEDIFGKREDRMKELGPLNTIEMSLELSHIDNLEISLPISQALKSQSSTSFHSDASYDEKMVSLMKALEDANIRYSCLEEETKTNAAKLVEQAEIIEKLSKEKQAVKKASLDTKVLVLEVADKHDIIMKLRREINEFEEKLRQADMQTHFKDEIIKELRREGVKTKSSHSSRDLSPIIPDANQNEFLHLYDVVEKLSVEQGTSVDKLRQTESKEMEQKHLDAINNDKMEWARLLLVNFGKEPSEEAINLIANGDMTQIQNLLEGFKRDINSKDLALKSKDEAIHKLQNELTRKEEELLKYRSKNEEELQRNIEKINILKKDVKTLSEQNNELRIIKTEMEDKLNQLEELISSENHIQITEEKNKLEFECKNQLQTISNLREALEASSKRSGNSSVSNTPTGQSGGFMSSWWRNNVHDV